MSPDQVTLSEIRALLDEAEHIDASRIEVVAGGTSIVLRGAVSSHEQATAAATLVEQHADAVTNDLVVDPNLREDATALGVDVAGDPTFDAPDDERTSDVAPPAAERFDETADVQDALDESVPLDPPDQMIEPPTEAEERQISRDT